MWRLCRGSLPPTMSRAWAPRPHSTSRQHSAPSSTALAGRSQVPDGKVCTRAHGPTRGPRALPGLWQLCHCTKLEGSGGADGASLVEGEGRHRINTGSGHRWPLCGWALTTANSACESIVHGNTRIAPGFGRRDTHTSHNPTAHSRCQGQGPVTCGWESPPPAPTLPPGHPPGRFPPADPALLGEQQGPSLPSGEPGSVFGHCRKPCQDTMRFHLPRGLDLTESLHFPLSRCSTSGVWRSHLVSFGGGHPGVGVPPRTDHVALLQVTALWVHILRNAAPPWVFLLGSTEANYRPRRPPTSSCRFCSYSSYFLGYFSTP